MRYDEIQPKKLAYKVMRYDPETGDIISGADNRQTFSDIKPGSIMNMRGNGIYVSTDKQYVLDYYSELHDNEALLTFEYQPKDILWGNDTDRQSEFTINNVKVIDIEYLEGDDAI